MPEVRGRLESLRSRFVWVTRRSFTVVAAALSAVALASPAFVGAQQWPSKPVKLIAPTGPGLNTDVVARLLADRLSRAAGQQFVVENIPGAATILGAQAAARAAPDGYTFLFATGGTLIVNMFSFKSLPYDPVRDFTPVARISENSGFVVSTPTTLAVKTLGDLLAYAKQHPGQVSYAVDASSGIAAIVGRMLNKTAGIDMVEVPYKSTAQALQDTLAGRTQLFISTAGPVAPFAKSGKLRMLATSAGRRYVSFPDMPTFSETIPGLQIDSGGFFVVAPAHVSTDIVLALNRITKSVLLQDDFVQRLLDLGLETNKGDTPQEAMDYLRTERARWGKIFPELGIEPQ